VAIGVVACDTLGRLDIFPSVQFKAMCVVGVAVSHNNFPLLLLLVIEQAHLFCGLSPRHNSHNLILPHTIHALLQAHLWSLTTSRLAQLRSSVYDSRVLAGPL
jgi:hypothetical protein